MVNERAYVPGRRKEKNPELETPRIYGTPDVEAKPTEETSTPTAGKVTHKKTGHPWRDLDHAQKPENLIIPDKVEHKWTPAETTRSLHEQRVAPKVFTSTDRPAQQPPEKPTATPTTSKTIIEPDTITDPSSWTQAHGAKKQDA